MVSFGGLTVDFTGRIIVYRQETGGYDLKESELLFMVKNQGLP